MQVIPGMQPYGYGYLPPVTADDRNMAMLCHLLSIFTGFIGPLIVWLAKKDQSPFVYHHGKESLNFQITVFLAWLIVFGTIFSPMAVFTGFLMPFLVIALPILALVAEIMACVAANNGQWHRYPCCLRLI